MRLMREDNVLAVQPQAFVVTTDVDHALEGHATWPADPEDLFTRYTEKSEMVSPWFHTPGCPSSRVVSVKDSARFPMPKNPGIGYAA